MARKSNNNNNKIEEKEIKKMSTVKEEVISRLVINDEEGKITSALKPEESAAAKRAVDQEADLISRRDNTWDDYDPEDNTGSNPEETDGSEDLDTLITHCDAYKIGDRIIPVIVTKNLTDVLSRMKDGIYTIATLSINYKKTNAITIESTDRAIERKPLDMPRGKKGAKVEDGLIVVELNSINGFKVSVLYEEVSDADHKQMMEILNAFSRLQGNLLGHSLEFLNAVAHDLTVQNQASIGLAKQVRKAFISRKLDQIEKAGGKRVVTKVIQNESATVANEVNNALQVKPLTDYSLQSGIRLQHVTRTSTKPTDWESRRSSVTYKETKSGFIKIERIADNVITVPMLMSDSEDTKKQLELLTVAFLALAERIARKAIDIDIDKDLPLSITPNITSKYGDSTVSKVLGMDTAEFLKVAASKSKIAQDILDKKFSEDQIDRVTSLLSALSARPSDQ